MFRRLQRYGTAEHDALARPLVARATALARIDNERLRLTRTACSHKENSSDATPAKPPNGVEQKVRVGNRAGCATRQRGGFGRKQQPLERHQIRQDDGFNRTGFQQPIDTIHVVLVQVGKEEDVDRRSRTRILGYRGAESIQIGGAAVVDVANRLGPVVDDAGVEAALSHRMLSP